MTVQDDLRVLIDDVYPVIVDNYNIILTKLNEGKAEIEAEIIVINDGVLDGAETDHLAALEAKRVANGWALVVTYGNYGIDNLTEWKIYAYNGAPLSAIYLTADSFKVNSVVSPDIGSPILAQPGSLQRVISAFAWGPIPIPPAPPAYTYTNVALEPGTPLPGGLTTVDFSSIIYSPTVNWDNDTNISDHQDAFALGLNQLTQEPGLSGTYGLIPRRDQISVGIGLQTINRDKYQEFIDKYEPYAA